MNRHWVIRGSGDLQLLTEQGHRQRHLAIAIQQQLAHHVFPPHLVEQARGRIEKHMVAYAKIMRSVDLYEKSSLTNLLVIDPTTWDVVKAAA